MQNLRYQTGDDAAAYGQGAVGEIGIRWEISTGEDEIALFKFDFFVDFL